MANIYENTSKQKKRGRPKKAEQKISMVAVDELDLPIRSIIQTDEQMEALETWTDENIQSMIDDQDQWQTRRKKYINEFENLLRDNRTDGPWEGSADFHVPLTMWMMKQTHARLFAAIIGDGYGFTTVPQEKMDMSRVMEVDQIMRWAIQSYANNYNGISLTIDDWIWDTCKEGWGVLKVLWDRRFQKVALTKDELERFNRNAKVEEVLESMLQIVKSWEGPQITTVAHENILFPGRASDSMDMNEFPIVAELIELTEEQIKQRINDGRWFKEPAEEVLKKRLGNANTNTTTNRQIDDVRRLQDAAQGVRSMNSTSSANGKYPFYEVKARVDVDNDSIEEDLVYVFSPETKRIMTITTLDRVNVTMSSYLHKVDFIRRPRRTRGIGLCELLYSMNKEVDAMHNQRIDFGTIASIPTFFFRPLAGMKGEKMRLAPGQGIPLSNPRNDVFIPNFNTNVNFTRQEEGMVIGYAERLAALPAITSGQSPSPAGPASTATGMTSLLSQTGFDFDVILNRFKKTYENVLKNIHALCTIRMPDGMKFRVLGSGGGELFDSDGNPLTGTTNRIKLYGSFDFKIRANDRSLNREVEKQDALVMANILMNPVLLQSGIVQPTNLYNIAQNILMKRGEIDIDRFITKIEGIEQPLTLINELVVLTQNQMPRIVMHDDHEAKVNGLTMYLNSPEFANDVQQGVVERTVPDLFRKAISQHQKYLDAIIAQANQANVSGQQVGTSLGARMSGELNQQTGQSMAQRQIETADQQTLLTQGGLELPSFGLRQ